MNVFGVRLEIDFFILKKTSAVGSHFTWVQESSHAHHKDIGDGISGFIPVCATHSL